MSKQVPAAEPQADKSNKPKLEPVVSSELANDLTGLTGASSDLLAASGDGSVAAQAVRLSDSRLLTAQRHALLNHMGRVQGNRHVQRVVASLRHPTKPALSSTPPTQSSIQREGPTTAPAAPAPAKAPGSRSMAHFVGRVISDDPAELLKVLEDITIEHGLENAGKFVDDFQSKPHDPAMDEEQEAKIKAALKTQLGVLEKKTEEMLTEFERIGLNVISDMLHQSEQILHAEKEKYGLKELDASKVADTGLEQAHLREKGGTGRYDLEDNEQTQGLAKAAAELAPKRKELDELHAEQQKFVTELPFYVGHGGKIVTDQKRYDELSAQIKEKETAYNEQRAKLEADYPILAAYAGKGGAPDLAFVGQGSGLATQMIATLILDKLKNIERVREGVSNDEIKIWKLPTIMTGTKNQLGYTPGTLGHKVVEDRAAKEKSKEELINLAVAAISIALGLVAAVPTGGASVGVSLAVGGAQVASATMASIQAISAAREYELAEAMSGSDPDKAKAISQDEPSLFWLALDIVGAIADIHGAFASFKSVSGAYKTLAESGDLRSFAKQAKAAVPGENSAKITAYAARRAEVAEAITRNIRKAGDAIRLDPVMVEGAIKEVKRILGPELTKAVEAINQQRRITVLSREGLEAVIKDADEVRRLIDEENVLSNLGYYSSKHGHIFIKPGNMGHLQSVILHECTHHVQVVKLGREMASLKNEFQALYMESRLVSQIAEEFGIDAVPKDFRKLVDLSYEEIKEVAIKLNPNLLDEEKIFASFDAQKAVEEILAAQKTF